MSYTDRPNVGLWNSEDYSPSEVVSIDMKSCYTASEAGFCDARKHFKGFGHPGNRIVRVAVNGELPDNTGTGFCEVVRGSSRKVCTQ